MAATDDPMTSSWADRRRPRSLHDPGMALDLPVLVDPAMEPGTVAVLPAGWARSIADDGTELPLPELLERADELAELWGCGREQAMVEAQRELLARRQYERAVEHARQVADWWQQRMRQLVEDAMPAVRAFADAMTQVSRAFGPDLNGLLDELHAGVFTVAGARCCWDHPDTELLTEGDASVCPVCVLEPLTTAERAAMEAMCATTT